MNKNHLGDLVIESLKYFFPVDPSFCNHVCEAALVFPFLLKLLFREIATYFHDGAITIKEDALTMKEMMQHIKERWHNSEVREAFIDNTRTLINNLPVKNFRIRL